MSTVRFQPYWTARAHPDEHRDAGVGPSTLVPPQIPYVALPTAHPSGGTSEATADAENNDSITEEDTAPASNFYCSRIPHGTESPSDVRSPGFPASIIWIPCGSFVLGREGGRASGDARPTNVL